MRQGEPRPEKVAAVEELKKKIDSSSVIIFTDYQGLNVADITTLRRNLKKVEAEYAVVKNTLLKRALPQAEYSKLRDSLVGSTAIILGYGNEVLPAKAIYDFVKKFEKPKIAGAIFDKKVTSAEVLKQISNLPSRETLIAMVVGGIKSPISGLHAVLSGNLCKLVYVLDSIKKIKEGVN